MRCPSCWLTPIFRAPSLAGGVAFQRLSGRSRDFARSGALCGPGAYASAAKGARHGRPDALCRLDPADGLWRAGSAKKRVSYRAHPGKPAEVSLIELTTGKALLRRTGTAPDILSQADEFSDAWVEVVLKPEGQTSELIERIRALPDVVSLRFETRRRARRAARRYTIRVSVPQPSCSPTITSQDARPNPSRSSWPLFERLYREVGTARDEPV